MRAWLCGRFGGEKARVARALLLLLAGVLACGRDHPLQIEYDAALGLWGSLYLPTGPWQWPVPGVVLVHGGCFDAGSRDAMQMYGQLLSARGMAALAIDYRLTSRGGGYPAAVDDVRRAVRWLEANAASYAIDPARIGLLGASAGGFLAAAAALAPERDEPGPSSCAEGNGVDLSAVVVLYAVSDWRLRAIDGMRNCEQRFLARACDPSRPATCGSASLVAQRRRLATRFLLLHGSEDEDIPLEHSQRLMRHLQDVGIDASLEIAWGQGHGFDLDADDAGTRARRRIVDFLHDAFGSASDAAQF